MFRLLAEFVTTSGLTEQGKSVCKPTWLQPSPESHHRLVENPHDMKPCEESWGRWENKQGRRKREREGKKSPKMEVSFFFFFYDLRNGIIYQVLLVRSRSVNLVHIKGKDYINTGSTE